jgi:hypothetical protein
MNDNFLPPEESLIQEGDVPANYSNGPDDGDEEKVGLQSDGGEADSEAENDGNEVTI